MLSILQYTILKIALTMNDSAQTLNRIEVLKLWRAGPFRSTVSAAPHVSICRWLLNFPRRFLKLLFVWA